MSFDQRLGELLEQPVHTDQASVFLYPDNRLSISSADGTFATVNAIPFKVAAVSCQMTVSQNSYTLAYENAYDVGILVSGDEDFVPAIEVALQKGKIIVAVSAEKMLSSELRKKADRVVLLNKPGDLNFKNFLALPQDKRLPKG